MVHCITLAVPVSGLRFATALDQYSQGDTVDHINQSSVMNLFQPNFIKFCDDAIVFDIFLSIPSFKLLKYMNY